MKIFSLSKFQDIFLKACLNEVNLSTKNNFLIIENKKSDEDTLNVLKEIDKNTEDIISLLNPELPTAFSYPLSSNQKSLWLIDKIYGSTNYHLSWNFEIEGQLDSDLLAKAFDLTIKRNLILTTVYKSDDNDVYQVIHFEKFKLSLYECPKGDDIDYRKITNKLIEPFSLSNEIPIRAALLKLKENNFQLFITIHHIAFDGWSINIFLKELVETYFCLQQKSKVHLINKKQYFEYCLSEGDILIEHKIRYWKKKLKNLDNLKISDLNASPFLNSTKGDSISLEIPSDVLSNINKLSILFNTTPFVVLLTAYIILLTKISSTDDICVGIPVGGRPSLDYDNTIGNFVNMLPLRIKINKEMIFSDLILFVRRSFLDAIDNQIPFDELVSQLEIERNFPKNPFFQFTFSLNNLSKEMQETFGKLKFKQMLPPTTSSKFDLGLNISTKDKDKIASIVYKKELFSPELINSILKSYITILTKIDIHRKIYEVEIVDADMQYEILEKMIKKDFFTFKESINDLFIKSCRNNSASICFFNDERKVSYDDFLKDVSLYSSKLLHLGIKKGDIIGLNCNKSIELVTIIWAIIQIGAIFVPLDPKLPIERITYILKDTSAKVLFTEDNFQEDVFNSHEFLIFNIYEFSKYQVENSKSQTWEKSTSQDLVYIIYTSGTTGYPKGVPINQTNILCRIPYFRESYNLNNQDKCIFYRSIGFDGTLEEYFMPIFFGSSVYIASNDINHDILYNLVTKIKEHKITKLNMPPILLNEFLKYIEENNLKSFVTTLKYVVSGGDKLELKTVKKFHEIIDNAELFNTYGPTENTIDSTSLRTKKGINYISLGKPIKYTQIYILNRHLNLMPIGIAGRIYIGGDGLTSGYHNNKALNTEKFTQNPFNENEKIYDSGDLGILGLNGEIYFLGREDNQVQINGIRVELGEIKIIIDHYPDINNSEIVVENIKGFKRLLAFVIVKRGFKKKQLLDYIQHKLPQYLIPELVIVDHFPINNNGKINFERLLNDRNFTKPEFNDNNSSTINKLLTIFKNNLKLTDITIDDSFFTASGNSLLSLKVIREINQEFSTKISVKDFFLNPTIKSLSSIIENYNNEEF